MTPDQVKTSYRRQLAQNGELVGIKRGAAAPVMVLARVTGFVPSDVVGSIQQGSRRACVLAEDLAGFPLPFQPKQDRLVWNGKTLTITDVDDATVRVAGVTVAYWLALAGP